MIDVKFYLSSISLVLFFFCGSVKSTANSTTASIASLSYFNPPNEDSCYIDTVYLKEKFSFGYYIGIWPAPDSIEWRFRPSSAETADSSVADSLWTTGGTSDTCCVLISGMEELTSYAAQVRIWCDSTGYEPWSAIVFDTTRCVAPSEENLNISQSGTSATMSWDVSTTAWEWVLRKVEDPTAKHVVTDVNTITWKNLDPDAEYAWKVRVKCGDTWSDYSTERFFNSSGDDGGDCPKPTDDQFGVRDITSSHATLYVEADGTQYRWALKAEGASGWNHHTTTFDYYKWKQLKPGTKYEYKVQVNCGNNTWSSYSDVKYFTTEGGGGHYGNDCTTPYGHHMSAKDITYNSATTHCNVKGSKYHWYMKEYGSSGGWKDYTTTSGHHGWKNLKHNTKYAYKVKIKCPNGYWTGWSPTMYFTTHGHYGHKCSTPGDHHMYAKNIGYSSASTFCDVKGKTYHWYLKAYGSYGGWIDYETHNSQHDWKNLKADTKYAYKVKVKCDDGYWTGWSPIKYFTTKGHYGEECTTPYSHHFSVKDLSYNSATTHVSVQGAAYHWFLREHGKQSWSDYNTHSAHHKWSGLKHNTKYEYKVKIKCHNGQYTGWSPTMYFTTHGHYQNHCSTPYSHHLTVKDISYNSATTHCEVDGKTYHWHIKEYNHGGWTGQETSTSHHNWSGLKANTKYAYKLKIKCKDGYWTDWSPVMYFTTHGHYGDECSTPYSSHMSAKNITYNSASTYCNMSGASYHWYLKEHGSYDGWTDHETHESHYGWSNLKPNTKYGYKVKIKCHDGHWTGWSPIMYFTTHDHYGSKCGTPYAHHMSAKNITYNSASTYCDVNGASYHWYLKEHGSYGGWTHYQTPKSHYGWKNLKHNTKYSYKVKVKCHDGTWSGWSPTMHFTTHDHYGSKCSTPYSSHMSAKNITYNSASTYCDMSGASYHWYLKEHGSYGAWSHHQTSKSHYGWNNLKHNTKYAYKVKVKCHDGYWTGWSPTMYFTTHDHYGNQCSTPYGSHMTVKDISYNSASTHCSVSGSSYHWYLKESSNSSPWIDYTTTQGHYGWNNLKPNTKYAYKVKVKCHNGYWTGWSPTKYFTTHDSHYGSGYCSTPQSHHMSAQDVTYNSASTYCNVSGSNYHWYMRPHGSQAWIDYHTTSSHHAWHNLNYNTKYEYKVKVQCHSGYWTSWSPIMYFTTHGHYGGHCAAPGHYDFTAKQSTYNLFKIHIYATAVKFTSAIRVAGQEWSQHTSTSHITGWGNLVPNTMYEYRVRIQCADGSISDWSTIKTFWTGSGSGSYRLANEGDAIVVDIPDSDQESNRIGDHEMSVYPSPAFDHFSVSGIPAGAGISIISMQGKSVMTHTVESTATPIDVGGLENGLYQVLYVDDQGVTHAQKLVIMH